MVESINTFNYNEELLIQTAKTSIRAKMVFLRKILHPNTYDWMFLSGGAIPSLIQGEEPKDWDVYFMNQKTQVEVFDMFIADNADEIAVVDEKYREVPGSDGKMITENAMTLKNGIQFIIKHTGTPDEVRETFDFVHCKPYYHFGKDQLFISREQFDLCLAKKLKCNNPFTLTMHREEKFKERGYTWQL